MFCFYSGYFVSTKYAYLIKCRNFKLIVLSNQQIYPYFDKHILSTEDQSGFRANLSTFMALEIYITNDFVCCNKILNTCATLIGLTKAFDSVFHYILVK